MAIITLAAPISGIRGKVGGIIYSANKAGPFVKSWARGSNPRTFLQTVHRSSLSGFAIAWKTLSGSEQSAWDTYAALPAQDLTNSLGETYSISGFNWYIRINLNRLSAGDAFTKIAPTLTVPTAPTIDTMTVSETDSASDTFITLQAGSPGLGERLVIKAVLVSSSGVLVMAKVTTFMLTQELAIGVLDIPFKPELLTHFGTAQVGQRCFATIQHQDIEGRRSVIAAIDTVVT